MNGPLRLLLLSAVAASTIHPVAATDIVGSTVAAPDNTAAFVRHFQRPLDRIDAGNAIDIRANGQTVVIKERMSNDRTVHATGKVVADPSADLDGDPLRKITAGNSVFAKGIDSRIIYDITMRNRAAVDSNTEIVGNNVRDIVGGNVLTVEGLRTQVIGRIRSTNAGPIINTDTIRGTGR